MASPFVAPSILIVEDDPGMRQYLRSCLEPLGAQIDEVADGEEALAWLRTGRPSPDLVISDVIMPQVGGVELLAELHADPDLNAIPLLFVTGESELTEASGHTVLRKPFSGSLLRIYVEELLRQG